MCSSTCDFEERPGLTFVPAMWITFSLFEISSFPIPSLSRQTKVLKKASSQLTPLSGCLLFSLINVPSFAFTSSMPTVLSRTALLVVLVLVLVVTDTRKSKRERRQKQKQKHREKEREREKERKEGESKQDP